MDKRSFFKHAAVYGLANVLVQLGNFLLLPIYIRCLSPAEYGVLEVLGRLAETVGTCLMFGGFRQALLTFYQQSDEEPQRRRIVSSTLAVLTCTCLCGGVVVLGLAQPLSAWLSGCMQEGTEGISATLLRLAVLGILLEPLSLMPLALFQARRESARFVLITVSQFLIRITLCILLVRYQGLGVRGALLATVCTGGPFGLGLCLWELGRGAAWPDLGQVRALLRFSLPLMPGGLCFFLLHHGDRFFLLRFHPPEEVGTYALGYKLAMVASTFSLAPLYAVWSTHMYDVARDPDAPVVFGRAFTRILAAYLIVALGLGLFQEEVVAILGGLAYERAAAVVAPVLLACFFQAGSSLMDAGLYVRHRTGLKLGVTLLATAVMLVLYAVLIPRYGSMGAALATLGGFAFLAACTWQVTQRVFPVRYEWGRLTALLALTAGLWLAARALPAPRAPHPGVAPPQAALAEASHPEAAWVLPVKAGLWLLWPLAVWYSGLLSRAEKRYAADLLHQGLAHLPGSIRLPRRRFARPAAPANGVAEAAAPRRPPGPRARSAELY